MSKAPVKSVFAAGNRFENNNFSGEFWLNMLVPAGAALPVANVTFAPGCRNNWHAHQGGQVLLVTVGRGYYQEWAMPARQLQAGDVVEIAAHVKHWHGAAKDCGLATLPLRLTRKKDLLSGWNPWQMKSIMRCNGRTDVAIACKKNKTTKGRHS